MPGPQVHHRVGAETHCGVKLLDLFLDKVMEVGGADIGVNGAQPLADADRAKLVMDVARNDDFRAPARPRAGRPAGLPAEVMGLANRSGAQRPVSPSAHSSRPSLSWPWT